MTESEKYSRKESAFWMKLYEYDNGSVCIVVSSPHVEVVNWNFPDLKIFSLSGWEKGKKGFMKIWIPESNVSEIELDIFKKWAQFVGDQCVWLAHPKIKGHSDVFSGNELKYCVACDYNFRENGLEFTDTKTPLGEVEYQLKWRSNVLPAEKKEELLDTLVDSILKVFNILPINHHTIADKLSHEQNFIVSSIPSHKDGNLLGRELAFRVASRIGLAVIQPELFNPKPQVKEQDLLGKVRVWDDIFVNEGSIVVDRKNLMGKAVLVIDDLYQSGITMWKYAEFLRKHGAKVVYGIACVKARGKANR